MVHDHALHELHIRFGPWRQGSLRRRRKRSARLTRRTRLHHHRLCRIRLLCLDSTGEKNCGKAGCEQYFTRYRRPFCEAELPLAEKTIKLPLLCVAKHLESSPAKTRQQPGTRSASATSK